MKRKRRRMPYQQQYQYHNRNDPRSPIIIQNNTINIPGNSRMLLYRLYESDEDVNLKLEKSVNSLHRTWDIVYETFKHKRKLEEQLEKANEIMAKYKQKFGELDDENDEIKTNQIPKEDNTNINNTEKNESSSGAWFCISSIIVATAILGGCYYLKR